MNKRGVFITFEGIDGAGKSVVARSIATWLAEQHEKTCVVFTREPGGAPIAEKIRNIILDKDDLDMEPMTELLLYLASRREHLAKKIWPSLEEGKIVICDRYELSSIAYQGFGRGLGYETVYKLNKEATLDTRPDLTVFLDISPHEAAKRLSNRKGLDRLEMTDSKFKNQVHNGYLETIKKGQIPIIVIDARLPLDTVIENVKREITQNLKERTLICHKI